MAQLISHYYTSRCHYLQAKSQIHSSVFSQLSAIRSREAWLLTEVDKQCQVKVDTLTRQSDTLQQSLGHGLLQVSTSRVDSDGSEGVDSQIVQVLERFVFIIFKLRCPRPDRILPVFVQVVSLSIGYLPCRIFLPYGLQVATHEVHRSSLRWLMCSASRGPLHFSHSVDYVFMTFVLSLTQISERGQRHSQQCEKNQVLSLPFKPFLIPWTSDNPVTYFHG